MESINEQIKAERLALLTDWLNTNDQLSPFTLEAITGDASFRYYYRVRSGQRTWMAMDARPPVENVSAFVAVADALRLLGLKTPQIFQADLERGFLLISDLGDQTFLRTLTAKNADELYGSALFALSVLQSCRDVPNRPTPFFSRELMWQEWSWHQEWFLGKLLGIALDQKTDVLDQCYGLLVESAATQPQVFMHRDYHSANLMVLPQQGVGILDFQDAFIGPVTYDLASLLRDCYIDWPAKKVNEWALMYFQRLKNLGQLASVDDATFMKWFDWMGMQRHIKALFTFARKQVRDHQPQYLKHVPRTVNYLKEVSARYPEMQPLHAFITDVIEPALKRVPSLCAQ